MIIKCLVIDDEPLACSLLEDYIEKVDFLELIGKCASPIDAFKYLKTERIDLIFLDIQMPDMTGIEFLQSLNHQPKIIFTTAYENYAVESYNFNAIDYLLKPFSFSRFLKAIDKLTANTSINASESAGNGDKILDYIFINDNGVTVKVMLQDIYYIKGLSDYVTIKTLKKNYIVRENLKKIEMILAGSGFIRVHKSYIISIGKIESIKGNTIKILDEYISIGRLYKNTFNHLLNEFKLG